MSFIDQYHTDCIDLQVSDGLEILCLFKQQHLTYDTNASPLVYGKPEQEYMVSGMKHVSVIWLFEHLGKTISKWYKIATPGASLSSDPTKVLCSLSYCLLMYYCYTWWLIILLNETELRRCLPNRNMRNLVYFIIWIKTEVKHWFTDSKFWKSPLTCHQLGETYTENGPWKFA